MTVANKKTDPQVKREEKAKKASDYFYEMYDDAVIRVFVQTWYTLLNIWTGRTARDVNLGMRMVADVPVLVPAAHEVFVVKTPGNPPLEITSHALGLALTAITANRIYSAVVSDVDYDPEVWDMVATAWYHVNSVTERAQDYGEQGSISHRDKRAYLALVRGKVYETQPH